MLDTMTIDIPIHLARGSTGRVCLRQGPRPPEPPTVPRVPRVAKLVALALKFEGQVRGGDAIDYADLARLGQVTRARISQVVDLVNLAPDILEELLFMTVPQGARDPVTERDLRPLLRTSDWREQRVAWRTLLGPSQEPGGRLCANQRMASSARV